MIYHLTNLNILANTNKTKLKGRKKNKTMVPTFYSVCES